jgi:hypothetical protein
LDYEIESDKQTIRILYSPQTFLRLFSKVLYEYAWAKSVKFNLFSWYLQNGFKGENIRNLVETCLITFFYCEGFKADYKEISLKRLFSENNKDYKGSFEKV